MTQKTAKPITEKILRFYIEKVLANEKQTKASLEAKIDGVREQLKDAEKTLAKRIGGVEGELKSTQQSIRTVKEDLTAKADSIEIRLSEISDKIDVIGTRLDDHEGKPANIAHPAH